MEAGENPKIPRGSRRIREGKGKVQRPDSLVAKGDGTFRDILEPKCGKKSVTGPSSGKTVGAGVPRRMDFVSR